MGAGGGSRSFSERPEVLRSIIEYAADAFFVHDLQGKLLDANQMACDSLGYDCGELLRMRVQDVEAGAPAEELVRAWERLAPGRPVTFEGLHRRKDGSVFPVEVRMGLLEAEGDRWCSPSPATSPGARRPRGC